MPPGCLFPTETRMSRQRRFLARAPRSRFYHLLALFWVVLAYWGLSPVPIAAQSGNESLTVRYFEQLRQRRLFSVAEQLGANRLAESRLSPAEFIQISVELSKTYAEHARYTSGEEHDLYWQFAASVIDDALKKHGEHPRRLLLDIQRAFVPAKRGEFLRRQIELFPFDTELQKQTETVFQTAIERLKPMESVLARRHRQSTLNDDRNRAGLATYEIHDLLAEVRFRLAVTLQEFAKAKKAYSPAQTSLLKEASSWLELLSKNSGGDSFTLPAKIRLAENRRLRDDLNAGQNLLDELDEEESLPKEFQNRLMAERARWLLAKGRLDEAEARLKEFRQSSHQRAGELAYLYVFVLIRQWELAERSQKPAIAERVRETIQTELETIAADVGGYWGYRISLMGDHWKKSQKYGIEIAKLVRRAEARYSAGRADAAVADYDQAAALAQKSGQPAIAFELGYTLGSILIQQEKFRKAAESFQKLTSEFPEHERAPRAGLLKAYCLGKVYQADPTLAHHEEYAGALKSHIERYPDHETVGEAYWMLGRHEEGRRQNSQAITYYRQIPAGHKRALQGQLAVARCYEKVFARHDELESSAEEPQKSAYRKSRLEWEQAADSELGEFVESYPAEPKPLKFEQADVALKLARIHLTRTKPEYQRADRLLERILVSGTQRQSEQTPLSEKEQAEWERILKTARQLRIVSLAGQGLSRRAEKLVEELRNSSTRDVLSVMDGLMQVAGAADSGTRRTLGELQLKTALELNRRRDELEEAEKTRLDHCRAQAYLATDQPDEAFGIYQQMLAAAPQDAALRERVAGLLAETDDRKSLEKAKELWRSLQANAKPGSTSWLERRYQVARCSWKLGQREEARKLVGVTRLLYPKLGNEELKSKYENLEKQLNSNR